MFSPLVAITAVFLATQGAFELFVRHEPMGAVLIAVAFLVASIGATAAPYVAEIERRRRDRG
jgi:hydrogenase-4 membrane subunit HyfE